MPLGRPGRRPVSTHRSPEGRLDCLSDQRSAGYFRTRSNMVLLRVEQRLITRFSRIRSNAPSQLFSTKRARSGAGSAITDRSLILCLYNASLEEAGQIRCIDERLT